MTVDSDGHRSFSAIGQFGLLSQERIDVDLFAFHQSAVSDDDPSTLDGGDGPVARHALELFGLELRKVTCLGRHNDRSGERVFGLSFDGSGEGEEEVLVDAVNDVIRDNKVGDFGFAFGERAGCP